MLDNTAIQKKYAELSAKYEKRQIDDYDSFVRARMAEYYINTYHIPTDDVYVRIEEALSEPSVSDIASDYITSKRATSEDSKNSGSDDDCSASQHTLKRTSYSRLKKVLVIASTTAIGFVVWAFKRKKREQRRQKRTDD